MKINKIEKYILVLCSFLVMIGCEKSEMPEKPEPGPFAVTSTVPTAVPAAGATYTLTIDGTTNGWWIEVPNNPSWVTIGRKYGSASVTQNVKIGENKTGVERTVEIKISATNGAKESILVKQEK